MIVLVVLLLVAVYSMPLLNNRRGFVLYHQECKICDLTFDREANYLQHIAGRFHREQLAKHTPVEQLWREFTEGAPHWAVGCEQDWLERLWDNEELSSLAFKMRTECLHPQLSLAKLNPRKRARVWRYTRDALGYSYYSEVANVIASFQTYEHGHFRLKELFESFEVAKILIRFITDARNTFKQATGEEPMKIIDMACGHGLVGLLLAYRFSNMQVICIDKLQRNGFDAYRRGLV